MSTDIPAYFTLASTCTTAWISETPVSINGLGETVTRIWGLLFADATPDMARTGMLVTTVSATNVTRTRRTCMTVAPLADLCGTSSTRAFACTIVTNDESLGVVA